MGTTEKKNQQGSRNTDPTGVVGKQTATNEADPSSTDGKVLKMRENREVVIQNQVKEQKLKQARNQQVNSVDSKQTIGKVKTEKILVVDDDALVRDIVVRYLKELGFNSVDEADGGAKAKEKLADPRYLVDLVITDWEMPGINGLVLLKSIRKDPHREGLKVMVMTSQQTTEKYKIKRAAQWAVNAYMIKPFRGNVLKEKLEEVLGG